jgi:hypothetical protein
MDIVLEKYEYDCARSLMFVSLILQ